MGHGHRPVCLNRRTYFGKGFPPLPAGTPPPTHLDRRRQGSEEECGRLLWMDLTEGGSRRSACLPRRSRSRSRSLYRSLYRFGSPPVSRPDGQKKREDRNIIKWHHQVEVAKSEVATDSSKLPSPSIGGVGRWKEILSHYHPTCCHLPLTVEGDPEPSSPYLLPSSSDNSLGRCAYPSPR